MEINIPTEVVIEELMKKYYTKEEVDALVRDIENRILERISSGARVVFDTQKKSPKAKAKPAEQTKPPVLTMPEANIAQDLESVGEEILFGSAASNAEVIDDVTMPKPSGKRHSKPVQQNYDFIEFNPGILPS